jgi:hypothetical protein
VPKLFAIATHNIAKRDLLFRRAQVVRRENPASFSSMKRSDRSENCVGLRDDLLPGIKVNTDAMARTMQLV